MQSQIQGPPPPVSTALSSQPQPPQSSRPNKPIKQRPRKQKATQPIHQPRRPERKRARKEQIRRGRARLRVAAAVRQYAQHVDEEGREQREGEVEEEARGGFETKDAGADAEEGGGDVMQVGYYLVREGGC